MTLLVGLITQFLGRIGESLAKVFDEVNPRFGLLWFVFTMSIILHKQNLKSKLVRTSLKHGAVTIVNKEINLIFLIIVYDRLYYYFWSSLF